ncbi:MAG: carbohydrate binding family 9 domain-containing protein, partial [bacterium]|nr:carbohydrate binding family 9 domain-containing protein [bacterium]
MKILSFLNIGVLIGLTLLSGHVSLLQAVELQEGDGVIIPDKVSQPVKIDGVLDEDVWKRPPINKEFKTVSPNYGDPLGQETKVWAAYDKKNLYFAFKCSDSEPHKIKTSIARRDNISRDDQVGILLDASGNRQTSYEFYVNPNGIQADAVNSAVSVEGPDKAPDFVWASAGKIMDDGYQVEVRIPLESIRYQANKEVKMGVIFTRQISRLGTKGAWPEIKPGSTSFNFMGTLLYRGLKGALKLEVLPNFTYSRNGDLQEPGTWANETDTNIGAAIKYGITSSITAEATVNPDFSQVESDAFQTEVNQRYPIFYSEKRPFFMESKETLDFGVVKWGMMPTPVHTRRIVDPGWAVKFSGSSGRMNFAFLAANDRSPGRAWEMGTNPDEGKSAFFGIVRAKYNIGSDNSIGILYSGRHFAGQSNNVAGADVKYQVAKNIRSSLSYLYSATEETEGAGLKKGDAWNVMLQYRTSTFFSLVGYERYGRDFSMSTAFLNRTGISRWIIGAGPNFNMKLKKLPWLKSIIPYAYYLTLRDLYTKMDDKTRLLGITVNLAPMGMLNFEYYNEDEAWAGELFRKDYFVGIGQIQLFKWLHLNSSFVLGDAIYYDPETPFLALG